ncbi:MAG: hypothetical protein ACI37S_04610 [Candidatus Gastranaerophilaceae bacterium]
MDKDSDIERKSCLDNTYRMEVENLGKITATTLYKNDKIILYEETTKEVRKLENYGEFEITKVLKRIRFNENGKIIK